MALFLDGKSFAQATRVVAQGRDPWRETSASWGRWRRIPRKPGPGTGLFGAPRMQQRAGVDPFLRSLAQRGLDPSGGLPVVVDGGNGLRAAVHKAFGAQAAVQRCQWHKRENVVGYLPKGEQDLWRGRSQRAYERPTYAEAYSALGACRPSSKTAISPPPRVSPGLGGNPDLAPPGGLRRARRSKTTNCIESVNASHRGALP